MYIISRNTMKGERGKLAILKCGKKEEYKLYT